MIEVLLVGYFMACVHAEGGADVVVSCSLVEEGVGLGGMGGGSLFTRTPATLVLRDVAVPSDELLDTLTPFIPPATPDPDVILFEAQASSIEIPNGEELLHADCDEKEVMCEISRFFPHGSQESKEPAYFFVSLSIEGDGLGISLVLQTLSFERDQSEGPALIQNKLGLPLSQSGSLLTEVAFLVFSHANSISAPLRGDVLLNCGFRQQEMPPVQEVAVEWRLQHRGKGCKVLDMKSSLTDLEESSEVNAEREGSSVDAALLVGEGNASMSLTKLKVSDEGTYICTVSVGFFYAQQVVQLHITQPPRVSLSDEKLVHKTEKPQTLNCLCQNYYPLDVQMEWLSLSPTDTEPTVLKDQGSLSSHRQHGDGTFSLSSQITLPPTVSPGSKIICRVSHSTLDTPLSISLVVEKPETSSYWLVLGFLVITVLFFYQVMR